MGAGSALTHRPSVRIVTTLSFPRAILVHTGDKQQMRIAVCIKQVPDSEARLRVAEGGLWIDEEDMPFVINESDEYALEEALAIAEKSDNGEVVVFSLGGERVREALRKALAMGAHRAVHLQDPAFEGGDCVATARALAAAIQREECGLVLTGSQSEDAGFGATASMIAGHLGMPQAWLVMGLQIEDEGKSAVVTREMESGMNELFRLKLPAVVEVQAGINRPRYASLKGIMAAKRKEITEVSPADLNLSPEDVGKVGSRTEMVSVFIPESSKGAQMLEGDAAQAAAALVEKLRTEARVLS